MFLIIISLILTFITACLLSGEQVTKETGDKDRWGDAIKEEVVEVKFRPRMLFSLLWLCMILFGCFSSIGTGEVGIKTRFGRIVDTELAEGIHFKAPYEKIEKINIKVQKYENKDDLETSTKDMQVINSIKIAINYKIDDKSAVSLYRSVGKNYKETVLEPAIQETVKGVMSKYTAEELITKRSEVAIDMQETLAEKTNDYGINIIAVSIKNFDFSPEYNASIEKKVIAEQNALTAKQELETTKIEAEKKKIEAQAEAEANKLKEKTITDKILQQQFIEKWNGQLPSVTSGNNIIDVSKFIK